MDVHDRLYHIEQRLMHLEQKIEHTQEEEYRKYLAASQRKHTLDALVAFERCESNEKEKEKEKEKVKEIKEKEKEKEKEKPLPKNRLVLWTMRGRK